MGISKHICISVLFCFTVLFVVLAVNYVVSNRQDMSVIRFIEEQQIGYNKFILGGYRIGVSSAEDLGFYVRKNEVELHYGEQVIYIKLRSLKDKDFIQKLSGIGIEIYQKDDEYRIMYWGEVIKQWVA